MRLRDIRTNLHRLSSRTLTRSPSSLHPDATAGQPTPLGQRFLRRRAYASYGSALTPTDLLGVCLVAPTSTGLLADALRRAHTVRPTPWCAPRTAPGLRHIPHVSQPELHDGNPASYHPTCDLCPSPGPQHVSAPPGARSRRPWKTVAALPSDSPHPEHPTPPMQTTPSRVPAHRVVRRRAGPSRPTGSASRKSL